MWRAPSSVMAPQTNVFVASISDFEKPSATSISKDTSFSCSFVNPSVFVQNSSPSDHLLKANFISNALATAVSTNLISSGPNPLDPNES